LGGLHRPLAGALEQRRRVAAHEHDEERERDRAEAAAHEARRG
jgi:hypothetical protein